MAAGMLRRALLAMFLIGLSAAPAYAGRVVSFEIRIDGQHVLTAHQLDRGASSFDSVWDYLLTLRFARLEEKFVVPESKRPKTPFVFVADEKDPNVMTIKAPVRIFCRYGGDVQVGELRLLRVAGVDNEWMVHPEDVAALKKVRFVDREMRTMEQLDAAREAEAAAKKK